MTTNTSVNDTHNPNQASEPLPDESTFTAAYDRRLAEIQAVPDDELAVLNIDVHASVVTVLGVMPEIKALGEQIAGLPSVDQKLVGALDDYARAAGEANSRFVIATTPSQDIVAMNDQALKMRETLRSDAIALANRGLINREQLAGMQGLTGYKNVAFDLIDYANLMRDSWATIQGKTAVSAQEVHDAKQLGEQLVEAAGLREQGPAVVAATARIRQQALTLLLRSYDETRRAVVFLRWHPGDADKIAPSLYAGRGGSKRDEPVPAPTPPTPPAPAPVPPVVTPTNGAANLNGQAAVPAGHPGSPAFGA